MKKAKKFLVKGMVQGVGYRFFTSNIANRLGLYGYVKNLYDGSVEVYAIGSEDMLDKLKEFLFKGPSYSRVDDIEEYDVQIDKNYVSFYIRH